MNFKYNVFFKNLFLSLFIVFFNLIFVVSVFAQENSQNINPTPTGFEKINNPISADNVPDLIKTILEGVIKIGIPIIALAIIYSGFLFVTAIGNPGKVEEAKGALVNTVIGAALLLGAWALAQLISETVLAL